MASLKDIARTASHILFQPGIAKQKWLKKYCSGIRGKKILEIGSGKKVDGKYIYSVRDYFESGSKNNDFHCTDIDPSFGHRQLDITKATINSGYDIVICFNVLEHIYDFSAAIANIHNALRNGGKLFIIVPAFYPLHDEPHDYWRFTEHSLRRLLGRFRKVKVEWHGIRQYPFFYFVEARK